MLREPNVSLEFPLEELIKTFGSITNSALAVEKLLQEKSTPADYVYWDTDRRVVVAFFESAELLGLHKICWIFCKRHHIEMTCKIISRFEVKPEDEHWKNVLE